MDMYQFLFKVIKMLEELAYEQATRCESGTMWYENFTATLESMAKELAEQAKNQNK